MKEPGVSKSEVETMGGTMAKRISSCWFRTDHICLMVLLLCSHS